MQPQIGAAIRELRKERNVTQEALAEHLGISFQAVSKWENGTAYPDITLLPAIACYFGVSIDRLFDLGSRERAEKVEAVLDEWRQNNSEGRVEDNVKLLRAALAEHPTEWRLVTALMYSLFLTYGRTKEKSALEEAISLGEWMLRSCVDDNERFRAIHLLACSYGALGDTQTAMAMARRLPEVTALSVMASVAQGEEKEYMAHLNVLSGLFSIGEYIKVLAWEASRRRERVRALDLLEQAERVYAAFFGPHECLSFCIHLARVFYERARVKLRLGDEEGALSDLRRVAEYAIAYERLPWLTELARCDFDPVRGTPEFQAVEQMLRPPV